MFLFYERRAVRTFTTLAYKTTYVSVRTFFCERPCFFKKRLVSGGVTRQGG